MTKWGVICACVLTCVIIPFSACEVRPKDDTPGSSFNVIVNNDTQDVTIFSFRFQVENVNADQTSCFKTAKAKTSTIKPGDPAQTFVFQALNNRQSGQITDFVFGISDPNRIVVPLTCGAACT